MTSSSFELSIRNSRDEWMKKKKSVYKNSESCGFHSKQAKRLATAKQKKKKEAKSNSTSGQSIHTMNRIVILDNCPDGIETCHQFRSLRQWHKISESIHRMGGKNQIVKMNRLIHCDDFWSKSGRAIATDTKSHSCRTSQQYTYVIELNEWRHALLRSEFGWFF